MDARFEQLEKRNAEFRETMAKWKVASTEQKVVLVEQEQKAALVEPKADLVEQETDLIERQRITAEQDETTTNLDTRLDTVCFLSFTNLIMSADPLITANICSGSPYSTRRCAQGHLLQIQRHNAEAPT